MTTTDLMPYEGGAVEPASTATVAYMSFVGLRNLTGKLKEDGVPQVFDASFFRQYSGSMTAQIRGALRFLDFMDEEKRPTPLLVELVQADEPRRIEILRSLAESKYADVIALGTDATHGQLTDVFRNRGLSGQSITKAITFYLGLAEYTGIPVSPFFKRSRPAASSNTPRLRAVRPARRKRPDTASQKALPTLPPAPSASEHDTELLNKLSTAMRGVLERLPAYGDTWTQRERDLFARNFEGVLEWDYPVQDSPSPSSSRATEDSS